MKRIHKSLDRLLDLLRPELAQAAPWCLATYDHERDATRRPDPAAIIVAVAAAMK